MPIKSTTGYMLAQACKFHRQRAEALLNEIGLHVGQEMLLSGLWEKEGLTQTELADYVMIQPATVTNMLQRLERAGIVERRPDPEDQRISRVYATRKGRGLEQAVEEQWGKLEQESFAGVQRRGAGPAPSSASAGLSEPGWRQIGVAIFCGDT